MDPDTVPGILLTNRGSGNRRRRCRMLAPALLVEFGVEGFPQPGKEH